MSAKLHKTLERIIFLVSYFSINRGVGHTAVQLEGAKANWDMVLIVNNQNDKHHLRGKVAPRTKLVTLEELPDRLRGIKGLPLMIEHHAMEELFRDMFDAQRETEGKLNESLLENRELEYVLERTKRNFSKQLQAAQHEIEMLQADKRTLQSKLNTARKKHRKSVQR